MKRWARSVRFSRILSASLRAGTIGLLLFHAWLLLRRLSDGAFLERTVVFKWLWALALCGLWLGLRRLAVERRASRARLAFWILVILLHVGGTPLTPAGEWLQVLPLAEVGALGLPLCLAAWALELAGTQSRRFCNRRRVSASIRELPQPVRDRFRLFPNVFCRPPPFPSISPQAMT